MAKRVVLSWSSGKDSAWALYVLRQNPDVEVVGLLTTINKKFERVAMHAVRKALLEKQAKALGMQITILELPFPCSNDDYEAIMGEYIESIKRDVDCMAFGDLFLEDIRAYREEKLAGTGIEPIFPLWGMQTDELSKTMVESGLRSVITCVNPKVIPKEFCGRIYNESLLEDLPESNDPCGENGEFHSFVFKAPTLNLDLNIRIGETIERDGFVFTDVFPEEDE